MTSANNHNNSITSGPLAKSFLLFALPLIATTLLMQSYTIADGLILGNFVNEEALGSVNTISSVVDFLSLIQIGLSGGCSICISHLFGAEERDKITNTIRQMFALILTISIVMMALSLVCSSAILMAIHTPESVYAGAKTYLNIVCFSLPFMSMYNLQTGVLRSLGDSKRPLAAITISVGFNIGLDLILVAGAGIGIVGAAVATVAANVFSCIYLYGRMKRRLEANGIGFEPGLIDGLKQLVSRDNNVGESIRLGVPQMLQSAGSSFGQILLQNLTNLLGAYALIGVTVSYKIDSIIIIPMIGVSMSISVFTGQNIGAGNYSRVRQALKLAMGISLAISASMSVVLIFYSSNLLALFGISQDSMVIAMQYIRICLPFYWIFGLQFVLNGFLQGLKKTAISSGTALFALACRLVIAYGGVAAYSTAILPIAESASWIISVSISAAVAFMTIRKPEYK